MAQATTLLPVSNQEDWDDSFQLFDPETDEVFDLTDVTALELIVWDPDTRATMLTLALGSELTIPDVTAGVIELHVAESSMNAFCAKNYYFRFGMTIGGAIKDIILPGVLPVEDGGPP